VKGFRPIGMEDPFSRDSTSAGAMKCLFASGHQPSALGQNN
jgi:hypothetical protein